MGGTSLSLRLLPLGPRRSGRHAGRPARRRRTSAVASGLTSGLARRTLRSGRPSVRPSGLPAEKRAAKFEAFKAKAANWKPKRVEKMKTKLEARKEKFADKPRRL